MAGVSSRLIEGFKAKYPGSAAPRVVRAPGRVNLIGEHTDYNLGFVLPVAIELACRIAVAQAPERCLKIFSVEEDEMRSWDLSAIASLTPSGNKDWTDYFLGVAQQLQLEGVELRPMQMYVDSTVPVGSGLSSSASFEVASALAMLGDHPIPKKRLAQLCQRAENQFVGVPSGIMDQYTSVFGEAGRALCIDCRSLTHEPVELPEDIEIVAVNTLVKHSLGASAYGQRVSECKLAVESLRSKGVVLQSLRDATDADVEKAREAMSDVVYRRARHVTTENQRVIRFRQAAQVGDVAAMGELFYESHRSLRHDYEVSCEELDFLVEEAAKIPGVIGARMTGGGFGGCTVNLLRAGSAADFTKAITKSYQAAFGLTVPVYPCRPSAGASRIS